MRKIFAALALVLTGCVQTGVPSSTRTAANIIPSPIARCMNMGSALEAMFEGDWGYTVRRSDLVRLKQAGFDTIRLPVRWSVHAGREAPYTLDSAMLERVDEIIGWASDIDLNIIVNVHHYTGLNRNPDLHEPRLEAIWDQLATHYVGAADNLIFETINEPNGKMSVARTDALNVRLLSRIRQDHPHRWVILGTASWGQLQGLETSEPVYGERVMLTYHDYEPFDFTHQGAPWTDRKQTGLAWGTTPDVSSMMRRLDAARAIQQKSGMPILVGEFGVYEGVPIDQRARWTKVLRQGIESRDMSWCYWDFTGSLKVYDVETEAWIPELKSALLD